MIILGIDPGFASCGWAALEITKSQGQPDGYTPADHRDGYSYTCLALGVIRTKKSNNKIPVYQDNQDRCTSLRRGLLEVTRQVEKRFDIVAVEAESWTRTSSDKLLGMARGIIYSTAFAYNGFDYATCPIVQIRPQRMRKELLGKQSASKAELEDCLRHLVKGIGDELDKLPKGQRGHAADAAGVAITEALLGDTSKYILGHEPG